MNRDVPGGGVTLIAFFIGCAFIGMAYGLLTAAAVCALGFALVGELQRKANQILDALEKPSERP